MTIVVEVSKTHVNAADLWLAANGLQGTRDLWMAGWRMDREHFRYEFSERVKNQATLFKLTFGGHS